MLTEKSVSAPFIYIQNFNPPDYRSFSIPSHTAIQVALRDVPNISTEDSARRI